MMVNVRKAISEKHKLVVSLHNKTVENARIEEENRLKVFSRYKLQMQEEAKKKRIEDKDLERENRRFTRIKSKAFK